MNDIMKYLIIGIVVGLLWLSMAYHAHKMDRWAKDNKIGNDEHTRLARYFGLTVIAGMLIGIMTG